QEHVPVEPVLEQTEGSAVRVEPGYDPAAYTLTGNVAGSAPYTGVLRHKGWRVRSLSLPEAVAGAAPDVPMPAEVAGQRGPGIASASISAPPTAPSPSLPTIPRILRRAACCPCRSSSPAAPARAAPCCPRSCTCPPRTRARCPCPGT